MTQVKMSILCINELFDFFHKLVSVIEYLERLSGSGLEVSILFYYSTLYLDVS